MEQRTLTRLTKHKASLTFCAIIFILASFVLAGFFMLTLGSLTELTLGNTTIAISGLKELAFPLVGISLFLLLFGIGIFSYLALDKRKLRFTINDKSIDVESRKASYTVALDQVDYLHLLRLPGNTEYGFRETLAFYEVRNFSWTVIGPNLRDSANKKKPINLIQQENIQEFQQLKIQELREQLQQGKMITFPYLAEQTLSGTNHSQQEEFDRELIMEQDKGQLPVSPIMPTGAEISWQGKQLVVAGTEIDMYDIAMIQVKNYASSVIRKKALLPWNTGKQLELRDDQNQLLITILLPSLLNGDIFHELIDEVITFKQNKKD